MKGKKALRDLFAGAKECSTLRLSSFEKLNESQIAAHLSESLICHASDLGDSVVHDSSPAAGADHLNVGKRIRTTTKVSRRGTSSRTQGKARNRLRCRRMLIENTGAVNDSTLELSLVPLAVDPSRSALSPAGEEECAAPSTKFNRPLKRIHHVKADRTRLRSRRNLINPDLTTAESFVISLNESSKISSVEPDDGGKMDISTISLKKAQTKRSKRKVRSRRNLVSSTEDINNSTFEISIAPIEKQSSDRTEQSVMLDSVVSGEERSIAQVPKRKMTYRGRRGTRSSGGGNESVMRVDFGGVAQQKSCTPVDAEAPTKKPCRESEGDKGEPGEGIGVEEEGGGVGGGGAEKVGSPSSDVPAGEGGAKVASLNGSRSEAVDMDLTVTLDGDPLAKQSVMLDSVVSGEERSIAQVPKRKMTYRGRRGTRSSGGGNESVMRVDFGGVAQQKSCTPVDAEAPTKKACRVSEGDKSEPGEGIVVEEEGIGERGGGADSPDSVSIHRGWPSPVRVSGSLGYSFPSLPPLLVDTKSRNTLPTSRLSRPSKLTSGSALPRPSGLASRRTTTTTASVTDFAIRQTLNAREAKEVEEQLLCTSACEVEDLPPPQITLPTGATVTQENDRAPVVQPIHLPEDLSLSNSRLYQSMLETALMPPPAPPLKHRRGMFKGQAEPQTPSTAPVSSSLSNATTRRRSVQFAPVAEVMKQHPEGQWNRLSVAITEPCNLSPIPRVRESSDDDSSVDDSHCQNISILQASDTSDAEPRGRSRSRTSLPESSGPSVHETSGPSVRETRQSCEIDVDVDVESHWLPPADDGKEYDMSALRGVVRQGIMGWVEPEDPIFIPLRRSSQPQPPSESGVRRSSRIRIRPPRSSYERVYYGPRVNPKTGLPEIVPLGYLRYPDEAEARRRRRFLQRQRLRQHKPEAKAKLQRATKLRILAAKRRLLEGQGQGSPTKTVGLEDRLESDVVFVKDGTTSLPIGRLVHPEGPSDLPVVFETAGEAKAHLLGGVIQDYTVCEIAPGAGLPNVGPFEQSCHDITNVVSRKQKSRGLHFDAEANNLFTLNQPTSDQLKSDTVVFAVQIGTYAIPLSKPCSVLVPRGIPYKFVNSTSCTLSLIRLRFLPSDQ